MLLLAVVCKVDVLVKVLIVVLIAGSADIWSFIEVDL